MARGGGSAAGREGVATALGLGRGDGRGLTLTAGAGIVVVVVVIVVVVRMVAGGALGTRGLMGPTGLM